MYYLRNGFHCNTLTRVYLLNAFAMARELVHRVLVIEEGKLLGIVSSLDVCGTIGSVVFD